jgi:hypothetical protein
MDYYWVAVILVVFIMYSLARLIDQQIGELRNKVMELEDRLKQLEQ